MRGLPRAAGAAESEGFDRTHIDLPANQVALLDALAAVHDRLVVVLANGSAVALSTWEHHASARPGVLAVRPGRPAARRPTCCSARPTRRGRLAETIPLRLAGQRRRTLNFPGDAGHVRYGEGVFVGYRDYDSAELEVATRSATACPTRPSR